MGDKPTKRITLEKRVPMPEQDPQERVTNFAEVPLGYSPMQAIAEAQQVLWRTHRILVEPAGATALAALLSGAYQPEPNERVAVLVCGGNLSPDPLNG